MSIGLPQPRVLVRFIGALAVCAAIAGCGGGAQMRKIDGGTGGGSGGTGGSPTTDGPPVPHTDAGVDKPGTIVADLANGDVCASSAACKSGFCVDGVCCESACTGACLYCASAGSKGSCVPADLGTNPRKQCTDNGAATCGTDGYCDGTGVCEKYPAGVACQTAGCTGSMLTFAGRCDGNGTCSAPASQSCAPFTCGAGGQCKTTCSMDIDCAAGTFCVSGSCGKKPIGASCGTNDDCNSAFCAQGVCCATACSGTCKSCAVPASAGTCINVPAGQDPLAQCDDQGSATCMGDGFCDGKGACRMYAAGTSCGTSTCTGATLTPAGKCDGAGTCNPGAPQGCNAYACGTGGTCKTSCTADKDCGSGYFCVGGSCAKKGAGAACTTDSDCGTGHCAQGVCCKTACAGTCMSCALGTSTGTCTAIAVGMDPYNQCADQAATNPCGTSGACDGNGACAIYPAGTNCAAASCTGSNLTQSRTCDGAGTCRPATTATCTPFACGASACKVTCTTNADCVAPNVCASGSCGKLPPGAACTAAASCVSGFCAQGVCCDTACTGTCLSCALAGSAGTCSPVPSGKPPAVLTQCAATAAAGCLADGLCDGAGHCRDWPGGTQCAAASCTGASLTPAATCDGAGTCKPVTAGTCPGNLTCDTTANACKETCTTNADCVSPTVCSSGSCSLKPNGTTCSTGTECASNVCAQGVCCATACTGTCMSCAVSGSAGTCKAIPAGQAPSPTSQCATAAASTCGTNGLCDGTGKCQLYGTTTVCGPATCTMGDVATPARTCDGAGNCKTVTSTLCDPWGCGSSGACNTTCAANGDCTAPATCVAGSCGKLAIGQACSTGNACLSGFCVNGVCCNNACTGTCTACNLAGAVGTCTAVPAGQAPTPATQCTDSGASTCGSNGKCDGNGACQKYASGTTCVGAACTGSTLTPAATCNSSGMCVTPAMTPCNPYICGTGACKTSCTASADCLMPDICAGGSCVSPVTVTVQLAERDTFVSDAAVAPHFAIKNSGTNAVALSSLTLRYWYTEEGTNGTTVATTPIAQTASCDYAMISCSNITMSLVQVTPAVTGANFYLQVGFAAAAGTLAAGASTTDIQVRFNKNDYTNYNEADDYSYLSTTAYTTTTKVTAYLNGTLIYGTEPK
jgi:hypothetical protein